MQLKRSAVFKRFLFALGVLLVFAPGVLALWSRVRRDHATDSLARCTQTAAEFLELLVLDRPSEFVKIEERPKQRALPSRIVVRTAGGIRIEVDRARNLVIRFVDEAAVEAAARAATTGVGQQGALGLISREQAVEAAELFLAAANWPAYEARMQEPTLVSAETGSSEEYWAISWMREIGGIPFEGEGIFAEVDARSGVVYSMSLRWLTVSPESTERKLSADDAVHQATACLESEGVRLPDSATPPGGLPEPLLVFVDVDGLQSGERTGLQTRLAWKIVKPSLNGPLGYQVYVDAATGKCLHWSPFEN